MVTMQEELEEVAGQRVVLQHLKSPVHQKSDTRTRTHTSIHTDNLKIKCPSDPEPDLERIAGYSHRFSPLFSAPIKRG